jgi:hypothetical protein
LLWDCHQKIRERQSLPVSPPHCKECRSRSHKEYNDKVRAVESRPDRFCEICGVVLPKTYTQKKYCSRKCASRASVLAKPAKVKQARACATCGKGFETTHSRKKYCSTICYIKSYRPSVVKTCEYCGKETTRKRYCSSECWYQARRIKADESKKRYIATEKGKEQRRLHDRIQNNRRRSSYVNADFTPSDWKQALEHFDNKCAYCGKPLTKAQQEHFVPVAKGGGYTKNNILPSCAKCNSKKSASDPIEWLLTLPNPLVIYARIVTYLGIG